jgi:hypothetical protein
MSSTFTVPDDFLNGLVEELNGEPTVGIILTGSHARGDATPYSDVDVLRFVPELPKNEYDRYVLKVRGDRLVSISTTTVGAKKQELARPETAIWVVPSLRQARLLMDQDGSLAKLKREAEEFSWGPMQKAADEYASYAVMSYAEEVHKILGALSKKDESAILYGAIGLVLGLTKAVVVQRGVLIESENSYFRQAHETVGQKSLWSYHQRVASGFGTGRQAPTPPEARGIAGLQLYLETVKLLERILKPDHLDVIQNTLAAIRRHPNVGLQT